jgi:DNA polymerase-3 subunit epsilon
MLKFFNTRWDQVPTVWIDTETTGVRPGKDRAVQIGISRFEGGKRVGAFAYPVNPGIPIPAEATAIHGIRDEDVRGMPTMEDCFARSDVRELLAGAQPAAYNAAFDRHFVPPFGEDWTWPWADSLSIVRVVDRFERGKGRHRLEMACARHGVTLTRAHNAGADSEAAGELFYKLVPKLPIANGDLTLGELLGWQREQEAQEWWRFTSWLAKQPPREVSP